MRYLLLWWFCGLFLLLLYSPPKSPFLQPLLLHSTTPYHTTPHHTPSHHTTPYHTTPHHTTPHHTTPHHTTPHHTTPHHTTPRHTTPHHTTPHHTTPHHTTQNSKGTYISMKVSKKTSPNFSLVAITNLVRPLLLLSIMIIMMIYLKCL